MASSLQRNNGGPKGYGQPQKRNMRQAMLRPEDEQVVGGLGHDEGEMRLAGQGAAPSVYPPQPTYGGGRERELEDQGVSLGVTGPTRGQGPSAGPVNNRAWNPSSQGSQQGQGSGRVGTMPVTEGGGNSGFQRSPSIYGAQQGAYQPGLDSNRDAFYNAGRGEDWERHNRPVGPNGETQGLIDLRRQSGFSNPTMQSGLENEPGLRARLELGGQLPGQGQFPGLAQGDPSRGALAQYGTGNIAGGNIATGNFMGQLEGFNTGEWGSGERGTESIKNMWGRAMSRVDVTQPGAAQALVNQPEIKQAFPMARVVDHPNGDLIDLGDGNGPVDVIRGAVAGGSGAAWQWGANEGGGQPQMAGPGGPSSMAYQQGMPGMGMGFGQDPAQGYGADAPEVNDEASSMQFLQWLIQQQQQGQQPQGLI